MAFEKDKVRTDVVYRRNWARFKWMTDRYVVCNSGENYLIVTAACWDWDHFVNMLLCFDEYFI